MVSKATVGPFTLPELPFGPDSLAPYISAETLAFHYGKHHRGYVENLNQLLRGKDLADLPLEEVVRRAEGAVYRNAAQAWNHAFYWRSLSPRGGGEPTGRIASEIATRWGAYSAFTQEFEQAALGHFGSGWAWLTQDPDGSLAIQTTPDADSPLTQEGARPLLTCDVWEHAYYIDYRNDRGRYLEAWWSCVNWEFAEENLA